MPEKEKIEEENEFRNFPKEMGEPDEEAFVDYSNFRRNPKDIDVMRRVWRMFVRRLLPVLSLCYFASVLGMSFSRGTHFMFDKPAHYMSLIIILWVSIAPVTWLFMRATLGTFRDYATTWYFWIAGSQAICGLLFHFLFPTSLGPWLWGLQSFFVASIPMHIVIYIFFMRRAMPVSAALPLNIIGFVFLLLGLLLP